MKIELESCTYALARHRDVKSFEAGHSAFQNHRDATNTVFGVHARLSPVLNAPDVARQLCNTSIENVRT